MGTKGRHRRAAGSPLAAGQKVMLGLGVTPSIKKLEAKLGISVFTVASTFKAIAPHNKSGWCAHLSELSAISLESVVLDVADLVLSDM